MIHYHRVKPPLTSIIICDNNINDNYNIKLGTNVVQKMPLRTHLAHNKNIEVKLLLDKSQNVHNNIALQSLQQANIPIIYDQQLPAIAHNKVMIFDQKIVLTGSYNFTYSAQHRNAENLLLIYEPLIAQQYLKNWLNRLYAPSPSIP